jgi:dynactin complex subunit
MAKMTDYEKKLLEMQYLLKENNTYMQDTFADLENWSKDMKEKETKLKDNPDIAKISNKVIQLFFYRITN